MYTVRVNNRLPQAYRICKAAAPAVNYNTMSLLPRVFANDFAPVFRLMDDFASAPSHFLNSPFANNNNVLRSFSPRFDVKETSDAYELRGELPGVDQNDLNIEFTDAKTLSIKGRTETHREEGRRPGTAAAPAVEAEAQAAALPEAPETTKAASEAGDSAPSETSSYHKPTVEDEAGAEGASDYVTVEPIPETPTETTAAAQASTVAEAPKPQEQPQEDSSRYWISERSVGTFQRSFAFPANVDQENVRASLKNGILSIVIPKVAAPANRRINVE